MKKLILGVTLAVAALAATAQSNDWSTTSVVDEKNNTMGYIAYTNAIGTRGPAEKMFTSLRLVCSVTGKGDLKPYVTIFWNGMNTKSNGRVGIRVDDTIMEETWSQDGMLLFKPLDKLSQFMGAVDKGNIIAFEWRDVNTTVHRTAFSLSGFKKMRDIFYTNCKI